MYRTQTYSQFLLSLLSLFFLSCSRTSSLTMTPQLKTPIPSSVWLTKGRPGLTVSVLCWTNMTRVHTHTQKHTRRYLYVSIALCCTRGIDCHGLFCHKLLYVLWFNVCVYTLSSPRHGWTGRVWSHERTIHEDRGGLPARLLSHWQRKVSDSSRHVQTHSHTLPLSAFLSFLLFAQLCLLFTITHSLSLLLCLSLY